MVRTAGAGGFGPFGCGLALHADWSAHPDKRWMSCAFWREGGWHAEAPVAVGDVASLLTRLRTQAGQALIAFGIDCPLGLPRAYARRHLDGFAGFRDLLDRIQPGQAFFQVCTRLDELGAGRPFYPQRGLRGMSRAAHALALGLDGPSDLSRRCDRATATRPAGAPVLWTLGANQSGKAAIAAWRDLVIPALRAAPDLLHLWPFDGRVADWAASADPASVLLAETYPAEVMDQIGLRLRGAGGLRGSKRRRADRVAVADRLASILAERGISLAPGAHAALQDGFGTDAAGEDRFDSLLGLIGVLGVLGGVPAVADGVPDDPWIRRWEGWVFGLPDGPADSTDPPHPV